MSAAGSLHIKAYIASGRCAPGVAALTIPKYTVSGTGSIAVVTAHGACTLPMLTAGSAGGVSNAHGALTLPVPFFTAKFGVPGKIALPAYTVAGTGFIADKANGGLTRPRLVALGSATPGQIGTGALVIPLLQYAGTMHQNPRGAGALVIPLFAIEGEAFNEVNSVVPYRTVVVNTRHFTTSEYLNFNFDSFCEFPAGVFLATDDSGDLYQLYSDSGLDNGSLINAELQFGTTDFNVDTKKSCIDGFVNFRGDGSLEIDALVDEAQDPNSGEEAPDIYTITGIADGRLRNYKFKMSRKREGKNWRFSVKNVNGSDLDLNEVAVFYDILSRRI
jgi:hypothetical protein